jgi:hypothetical protein
MVPYGKISSNEYRKQSSTRYFLICSGMEAVVKSEHVEQSLCVPGAIWSSSSASKEVDNVCRVEGRRCEFTPLEILKFILCWINGEVRDFNPMRSRFGFAFDVGQQRQPESISDS